MIRIEKLVILGGQACDGQTTKILKKNNFLGEIQVGNTWYGYYNDTEGQLTC